MGPRASCFEEEKIIVLLLGFETRTLQSVVAISTMLMEGNNSVVATRFDGFTRKRSL